MAGFNKTVVVGALNAALADEVAGGDRRHAETVKAWEERRDAIGRAKKNARQAVRDLNDDKITIEEFAKRLNAERSYTHWFNIAAEEVPVRPTRVESARERSLRRVIEVVESSADETVTVSDLRGLGVLDFVKFPACNR